MAKLDDLIQQKQQRDEDWKAKKTAEREELGQLSDDAVMRVTSEPGAYLHYPDVMSIDEMCRALSIGKKTGYKLLQTGQIRFLKIGRAYRIPKINLLEYLQVIRPE